MDKRDKKTGQFLKGISASPETQFKKGQHWRSKKPYWDKAWLENEYINKKKPAIQIASEQNCKENNIFYFLKKHNISVRSMLEIRKNKYWGMCGEENGMFGRTGKNSVNWKGGCSPERQAFYSSLEWKDALRGVWGRDNGVCFKCKKKFKKIHIHHLVSFSVKSKRADVNNLITLCPDCHHWVHSNKNINKEYING